MKDRQHATSWSAIAVMLLLPAGVVAAQQHQSGTQQTQQQESKGDKPVGTTGTAAMMTVENIVDNPQSHIGKKVTIEGEVGDVFSNYLFNIEEKGVIDVDDELLVLTPKKAAQRVTEDSEVRVTGTVRSFVRADLERDYDINDWGLFGIRDDRFFIDYDNRPVVIADSVDMTAKDE